MDTITTLPRTELVQHGIHLRVQYLLQQAGYTLGIAFADGEPLKALMAPGLLDRVVKVRDELAASLGDKVVMAAESKLATSSQNMSLRKAREWARQAVARSRAAMRAGAAIPADMIRLVGGRSTLDVLAQMDKQLALLDEHKALMDAVGAPTQPLIDEGRKARDALATADVTQEQTRAATLPAVALAYYAKKGELYTGLKMINEAGHELYAHDAQQASRYNLSILYRRPGRTPAEAEAPAVPNVTPTAPQLPPAQA